MQTILEYDAGTLTSILIERDYSLSRIISSTFEVNRLRRDISIIFLLIHIGAIMIAVYY